MGSAHPGFTERLVERLAERIDPRPAPTPVRHARRKALPVPTDPRPNAGS